MRVLILGGTQFFGKDIARLFFEAGYEVTLFTRGNQRPKDLPPHQHIRGDRKNLEDLKRAEKSGPWDVVVDNLGYDARDMELALEAFKTAKRYLFCSTVSIYRYVRPENQIQPMKEEAFASDYQPIEENLNDIHWRYARGKKEAERVLQAEKKIPWTILRPPVVYGPFDVTERGFWYLARLQAGGPILLGNSGANSFRLVYSVDAAKSFLLAARSDKTCFRSYNIAQAESITLKQFLDDSAKVLGVKPEYVVAPSSWLGDLGGSYASNSMVNLLPDISAAEKEMGFRPTPWSDFCRSTALWFRDQWKGNRQELLATREDELKLARKIQTFASGK